MGVVVIHPMVITQGKDSLKSSVPVRCEDRTSGEAGRGPMLSTVITRAQREATEPHGPVQCPQLGWRHISVFWLPGTCSGLSPFLL